MANENKITAAFVQQFHDTYEIASAQNESRLLKTVVNRGKITGESFTINDMGQVEMSASGARMGNTTWTIPDAGVRSVLMNDFDLFIPIEQRDVPKLKANPQDKYMKLLLSARGRKIDDIIYQAAVGSVSRKVVDDAGATSTTAVALPAGQIILSAFGTLKNRTCFRIKSVTPCTCSFSVCQFGFSLLGLWPIYLVMPRFPGVWYAAAWRSPGPLAAH